MQGNAPERWHERQLAGRDRRTKPAAQAGGLGVGERPPAFPENKQHRKVNSPGQRAAPAGTRPGTRPDTGRCFRTANRSPERSRHARSRPEVTPTPPAAPADHIAPLPCMTQTNPARPRPHGRRGRTGQAASAKCHRTAEATHRAPWRETRSWVPQGRPRGCRRPPGCLRDVPVGREGPCSVVPGRGHPRRPSPPGSPHARAPSGSSPPGTCTVSGTS